MHTQSDFKTLPAEFHCITNRNQHCQTNPLKRKKKMETKSTHANTRFTQVKMLIPQKPHQHITRLKSTSILLSSNHGSRPFPLQRDPLGLGGRCLFQSRISGKYPITGGRLHRWWRRWHNLGHNNLHRLVALSSPNSQWVLEKLLKVEYFVRKVIP